MSQDFGIWWVPPGPPRDSEVTESFTGSPRPTQNALRHSSPLLFPSNLPLFYPEAMLPPPLSPPPFTWSSVSNAEPLPQMSFQQHEGLDTPSVPITIDTSELCAAEPNQLSPGERVWFAPRAYWNAKFAEEEARDKRRLTLRSPKASARAVQTRRQKPKIDQTVLTRSARLRNERLINLDGPVEIRSSRTRSGHV